ncbi:MAG: alpha/beta hydrolase-fold protein [Acidimicrobiales bacterium]
MIVGSRIDSAHLAGNKLGDPTDRDLFVYLPPGYETSDRHYPTAFLLHAFGQQAQNLVTPATDRQRWVPPIEDVLDPVFRRLGVPPMIVVIPDGWTSYGCSQWVNSPVCGGFEDYVTEEVVSQVDRDFRTIPSESSRGVLGFSSGGFGAWHLCSRNPDVFSAMAMLSGDSFFDMTLKTIVYDFLSSLWPDAPAGPTEGNDLSQTTYASAACYSPNVDDPPFFVDLPVDFPTGELIQPVWDRWLAFDPVVSWRDRIDNLMRLSGILLDVGINDDYRLQWGHRLLSHYLSAAGVSHVATENEGNHGGRSRERIQVALAWLSTVLTHDV